MYADGLLVLYKVLESLNNVPCAAICMSSKARRIIEFSACGEDLVGAALTVRRLNLNTNAIQHDRDHRALIAEFKDFENTRVCVVEESYQWLDYIRWWLLRPELGEDDDDDAGHTVPLKLCIHSLLEEVRPDALPSFLFSIIRVLQFNWSHVDSLKSLPSCLHLRELTLNNCTGLYSDDIFAPFHLLTNLTILTVVECDIRTVEGLQKCPSLANLSLSACRKLFSVTQLQDSNSLQVLNAEYSGIEDISGLNKCSKLFRVDFTCCFSLRSLAPLHKSPALEELIVYNSVVENLVGVNNCQKLKFIDISSCFHILTTAALENAPALEILKSEDSGVTLLEGLGTCPNLKEVNVEGSQFLENLRGLKGAPQLEKVLADNTGLQDVCGLGACPKLKTVHLRQCKSLEDLSPLLGSSVRTILADWSCVTFCGSLNGCNFLEELNLNYTRIKSLTELSVLTQLTKLSVRQTLVEDIHFVANCPALVELDISLCVNVGDLRPVRHCGKLRRLDAHDTAINSVEPLVCCPQLEEVNVSNCMELRDVSVLAALRELRCLVANHCGIPLGERSRQLELLSQVQRISL